MGCPTIGIWRQQVSALGVVDADVVSLSICNDRSCIAILAHKGGSGARRQRHV
jgi:hypothetical protein